MKLGLLLIFTIIVLTINIYSVNAQSIEKSGVSVELLNNTDYCGEKCDTKYEICYDNINLNQDLITKFKNKGNKTLEPEIYLERYEIETGEMQNCRKLTVHGRKEKFESIDHVICINDICFDEFIWWNSLYSNCVKWINATKVAFESGFTATITFSNSDIPYNLLEFIAFTNGTDCINDSGVELGSWNISSDINNISKNMTFDIKLNTPNKTEVLMWFNASDVVNSFNKSLAYYFDDNADIGIIGDKWNITEGQNSDDFAYSSGLIVATFDSPEGYFRTLPILQIYEDVENISIESRCNTTKYIGLINRWINISNYYDYSSNTIGGSYITVKENGVRVIVNSSGNTIVANTWYNCKVKIFGSTLEWYLDDNLVVSVQNGTHKEGRFGLYTYLDSGSTSWDNITGKIINYDGEDVYWTMENETHRPPSPLTPLDVSIIISSTTENLYLTNSTCLDNNNLYREWEKTVEISIYEPNFGTTNVYPLTIHKEYQTVSCPFGCVENAHQFGDDCIYPDYLMYGFIIIVIVIIILFMLYFAKGKR